MSKRQLHLRMTGKWGQVQTVPPHHAASCLVCFIRAPHPLFSPEHDTLSFYELPPFTFTPGSQKPLLWDTQSFPREFYCGEQNLIIKMPESFLLPLNTLGESNIQLGGHRILPFSATHLAGSPDICPGEVRKLHIPTTRCSSAWSLVTDGKIKCNILVENI